MLDSTVVRKIPDHVQAGLADGSLTQWGGVIRNSQGQIVSHLQFHNNAAIDKIGNSLGQLSGQMAGLQSLQMATMALQGINLGVTVVGFAIVCQKLNAISKTLSVMDRKIDQILQGQMRLQWEREYERRTSMMANIEYLVAGLRTEDSAMVSGTMVRLNEIAKFYEHLFDELNGDMKRIYLESDAINPVWMNATALRMIIAQAHAHREQLDEALYIVNKHQNWHRERLEILEQPLRTKPIPLWLGYPEFQRSKESWQELVRKQRTIPAAIDYAEQQYIFCKENQVSFDEYRSFTSDTEPFAYIEVAA